MHPGQDPDIRAGTQCKLQFLIESGVEKEPNETPSDRTGFLIEPSESHVLVERQQSTADLAMLPASRIDSRR